MEIRKVILLIIISVSLTANGQFKKRLYNTKELNVVLKSEIGAEIFMNGQEDFQDAIKITECPEFKINFVRFPYKVGDVLPFFKDRKNYQLYFDPNQEDYLDSGTIGIAFDKEKKIMFHTLIHLTAF